MWNHDVTYTSFVVYPVSVQTYLEHPLNLTFLWMKLYKKQDLSKAYAYNPLDLWLIE